MWFRRLTLSASSWKVQSAFNISSAKSISHCLVTCVHGEYRTMKNLFDNVSTFEMIICNFKTRISLRNGPNDAAVWQATLWWSDGRRWGYGLFNVKLLIAARGRSCKIGNIAAIELQTKVIRRYAEISQSRLKEPTKTLLDTMLSRH